MKLLLFLLFAVTCHSTILLNEKECREESHGIMEFFVCDKMKNYEKYYFEDAAGPNQVTVVPDRLYRNHNYITAYSTDSQMFIGKKLYKKEEWYRFRESLK